mmetsp:Transcript_14140/g.35054  ORF Transcript_14140/g.35054 Transcript_14140/m.35054 type:complete len:347 (-) Transcript_14140:2293-3333(-)
MVTARNARRPWTNANPGRGSEGGDCVRPLADSEVGQRLRQGPLAEQHPASRSTGRARFPHAPACLLRRGPVRSLNPEELSGPVTESGRHRERQARRLHHHLGGGAQGRPGQGARRDADRERSGRGLAQWLDPAHVRVRGGARHPRPVFAELQQQRPARGEDAPPVRGRRGADVFGGGKRQSPQRAAPDPPRRRVRAPRDLHTAEGLEGNGPQLALRRPRENPADVRLLGRKGGRRGRPAEAPTGRFVRGGQARPHLPAPHRARRGRGRSRAEEGSRSEPSAEVHRQPRRGEKSQRAVDEELREVLRRRRNYHVAHVGREEGFRVGQLGIDVERSRGKGREAVHRAG